MAFAQFVVQSSATGCLADAKGQSRVAIAKLVDDGRKKPRENRIGTSNPQFPRRWIGQELDLADTLSLMPISA
jgi:hypothetical protein